MSVPTAAEPLPADIARDLNQAQAALRRIAADVAHPDVTMTKAQLWQLKDQLQRAVDDAVAAIRGRAFADARARAEARRAGGAA